MTETKIAKPGASVTQGTVDSRLRVSLIMLPHSAVGGFAPRPRKLSPARSIIIVPISSMEVTRIGPILVTSMLDIGTMMMELAGLSFLGLGAKPPTAEWGSMMSDTRSLLSTVPWVTLAPGFAIFVTVMIFNLLGDTIRDYADPKSRGR